MCDIRSPDRRRVRRARATRVHHPAGTMPWLGRRAVTGTPGGAHGGAHGGGRARGRAGGSGRAGTRAHSDQCVRDAGCALYAYRWHAQRYSLTKIFQPSTVPLVLPATLTDATEYRRAAAKMLLQFTASSSLSTCARGCHLGCGQCLLQAPLLMLGHRQGPFGGLHLLTEIIGIRDDVLHEGAAQHDRCDKVSALHDEKGTRVLDRDAKVVNPVL
eukprot:2844608-Prymnesium_polylepis.1